MDLMASESSPSGRKLSQSPQSALSTESLQEHYRKDNTITQPRSTIGSPLGGRASWSLLPLTNSPAEKISGPATDARYGTFPCSQPPKSGLNLPDDMLDSSPHPTKETRHLNKRTSQGLVGGESSPSSPNLHVAREMDETSPFLLQPKSTVRASQNTDPSVGVESKTNFLKATNYITREVAWTSESNPSMHRVSSVGGTCQKCEVDLPTAAAELGRKDVLLQEAAEQLANAESRLVHWMALCTKKKSQVKILKDRLATSEGVSRKQISSDLDKAMPSSVGELLVEGKRSVLLKKPSRTTLGGKVGDTSRLINENLNDLLEIVHKRLPTKEFNEIYAEFRKHCIEKTDELIPLTEAQKGIADIFDDISGYSAPEKPANKRLVIQSMIDDTAPEFSKDVMSIIQLLQEARKYSEWEALHQ